MFVPACFGQDKRFRCACVRVRSSAVNAMTLAGVKVIGARLQAWEEGKRHRRSGHKGTAVPYGHRGHEQKDFQTAEV